MHVLLSVHSSEFLFLPSVHGKDSKVFGNVERLPSLSSFAVNEGRPLTTFIGKVVSFEVENFWRNAKV